MKIVRCHALFSSYASLPSLPFRHSFWFSCKIVGTADFQTLKRPLCYRLIPDMTTQHLRDLDAKREIFQNVTHCRLVQLQRRFFEYAQRSLAGCTQFLRARPAGFPEILEFRRASLAQNLRDIDAGRALFRIETHCRLVQEPQRHALVHAAHAGRFQATSLRAARQNSGKIAILSRDFCGRFARLRRVTRAFLHAQRTNDSFKSCNGVLWFA